MSMLTWKDSLVQDLRHAARTLRRSPGFASVVVTTLALAIGASTTMFTIVNAILLRPLDYDRPERLMTLAERGDRGGDVPVSPFAFHSWREQAGSFAAMAAHFDTPFTLTGAGDPEELLTRVTSGDFFDVVGVAAQRGRIYTEADASELVVVLGHALWRRRYGEDPGIIGRSITINDRPYTVVGVLPRDFHPAGARPDLWMPVELDREQRGRYLRVVARLRDGVSVEQARVEMAAIARRMAESSNQSDGLPIDVVPMLEHVTGNVRPALLVLFGAVGILLLIACANVASLLLGRAASRVREKAIRLSLGATRARLIRHALTESLLVAALAGMLGLILAIWGTRALASLIPSTVALPRFDDVRIDGRALSFAIGISMLTGILFGIAPAIAGSTARLAEALRESARSGFGARNSLRKGLVVAEVALAVVLLVGAALLGRSLDRLLDVDTGVRGDDVLTMRLMLTSARYGDAARRRAFANDVLSGLETLPGVRSAGAVMYLPLTGEKLGHSFWRADRARPREGEEYPSDIRAVAGEYFRTISIPLLRGRAFDDRDHENAPVVFVINEELAKRHFADENPVGKQIAFAWMGGDVTGEIVGVVGSVREMGPSRRASPAIYRPFAQMPAPRLNFVVRSAEDPATLATAVTDVVHRIDPALPVGGIRTMEQVAAQTVVRPRLNLLLLGGFSGMALLLAALGLYGVVSHSVTQRRHEIGVRVALGAQRGDVFGLVLRQGMRLTGLGLVLGLAAAYAASRLMASLLFGIERTDLVTHVGVTIFLGAVALLASYLPARRAVRLDPMLALRNE